MTKTLTVGLGIVASAATVIGVGYQFLGPASPPAEVKAEGGSIAAGGSISAGRDFVVNADDVRRRTAAEAATSLGLSLSHCHVLVKKLETIDINFKINLMDPGEFAPQMLIFYPESVATTFGDAVFTDLKARGKTLEADAIAMNEYFVKNYVNSTLPKDIPAHRHSAGDMKDFAELKARRLMRTGELCGVLTGLIAQRR